MRNIISKEKEILDMPLFAHKISVQPFEKSMPRI